MVSIGDLLGSSHFLIEIGLVFVVGMVVVVIGRGSLFIGTSWAYFSKKGIRERPTGLLGPEDSELRIEEPEDESRCARGVR